MDTTQYPYSSVVLITDVIGGVRVQASGVLIAPDEVLTAAHVLLENGQFASNIVVTPAANAGQFGGYGPANGVSFHVEPGGNNGTLDGSANDFAVIHLDRFFEDQGAMTVLPDFGGGPQNVTGYPQSAGGAQTTVTQNFVADPNRPVLTGVSIGAGSDGAPVWVTLPNADGTVSVYVTGVASNTAGGTGVFTALTMDDATTIQSWTTADNAIGSDLVDPIFYNAQNLDVARAGVNASAHYASFGWHEGRDPDAYFSTVGYLAANPDVASAAVDPSTHYDRFGWREGRDPSANFNTRLYLLHNPDVAAAGVDPLQHYLDYGQYEGRALDPAIGPASEIVGGFDPEYYLLANPDVARAGYTIGNVYQHYETHGWHEGRDPNPFFNVSYYLANNPDVRAAMIDPLMQYDQAGWEQGRNPSPQFNTDSYLRNAPDVAAAHIDPLEHYLQFGIYEGRPVL